jgi:hypothetical protein
MCYLCLSSCLRHQPRPDLHAITGWSHLHTLHLHLVQAAHPAPAPSPSRPAPACSAQRHPPCSCPYVTHTSPRPLLPLCSPCSAGACLALPATMEVVPVPLRKWRQEVVRCTPYEGGGRPLEDNLYREIWTALSALRFGHGCTPRVSELRNVLCLPSIRSEYVLVTYATLFIHR